MTAGEKKSPPSKQEHRVLLSEKDEAVRMGERRGAGALKSWRRFGPNPTRESLFGKARDEELGQRNSSRLGLKLTRTYYPFLKQESTRFPPALT